MSILGTITNPKAHRMHSIEQQARYRLKQKQAERGYAPNAKGRGTLYSSSHGQPGVPDYKPSTQKQRTKRFSKILMGQQPLPRYARSSSYGDAQPERFSGTQPKRNKPIKSYARYGKPERLQRNAPKRKAQGLAEQLIQRRGTSF